MHGGEKSDLAIVAAKPPNKAGRPAAEAVERRAGTEGNAGQQSTLRPQIRAGVSQALDRVRQAARHRRKERFTALLHHISPEALEVAFYALKRRAAPGVDGVTWQEYEADLGRRLADLHGRIHRGAYRPQPSRRAWIPKADGRQRPLAIAALEDKLVQGATVMVLNAIYEEDFLGFSHGFRPGRGPHDALDALAVGITSRKVNFILDAAIRSFFDTVSQDWLVRFVEHRIGDPRIIRLLRKWLKAGVLEDGTVTVSDRGTGQGSVISPLLAKIYLHHVFDLGAERGRRTSLSRRTAREVRGVRLIAPPGQDPPDRVRPPRRGRARPARARQAGDLRLPGLHLHLQRQPPRHLPTEAEDPAGSAAGEARGDQGGTAMAAAPAHPRTGQLAGAGCPGLLRLPRRADQLRGTRRLQGPGRLALAALAPAAQSDRRHPVEPDGEAGQRLPPETEDPSSLATRAVLRQAPEVGAGCLNRARPDLCGGRGETRVPTAIA